MQIENVAGISLSARGTANQKRQRAVSHGVLRKVVVNDQNVLTLIHEIFADGASGVGRDILQGRALGCRCRNDNGVIHRAVFIERVHNLGNGGLLLSDCNVNADNAFAALVDDRIGSDGGLSRLSVADDQLALAAADGNHGVDGLDTRLQRNGNGFSFNNACRLLFDGAEFSGVDRALAVSRLAERIHNAADHRAANGNRNNAAGTLHEASLGNANVRSEKNGANAVFLQVQRHAVRAVCKFKKLVCLAFFKAVHLRDTVTHGDNVADLVEPCLNAVVFDLFFYDLTDITRF